MKASDCRLFREIPFRGRIFGEFPITLEHTDKGIIATCDELNAVVSVAAEEEVLANLRQAIDALLKTHGEEIGRR